MSPVSFIKYTPKKKSSVIKPTLVDLLSNPVEERFF